ncbi:MAG: hypothetical protein Q7J98_14150 [Kiritimatiellia bacterium]|nr:hypothetical protein [Kiritimatiellia bacterium]
MLFLAKKYVSLGYKKGGSRHEGQALNDRREDPDIAGRGWREPEMPGKNIILILMDNAGWCKTENERYEAEHSLHPLA